MQFDKISIKGFRGIKSLEISGLSRVNLFVGKNNSSKTSVLEAVYILCGAYNPNLLINVDNFRGMILDEPNKLLYIFNDLDEKNEITIEGSTKTNKYFRQMKVKPNRRKNPQTTQVVGTVNSGELNAFSGNDDINELITTFSIKEEHKTRNDYKCSVYHVRDVLLCLVVCWFLSSSLCVFLSHNVLFNFFWLKWRGYSDKPH